MEERIKHVLDGLGLVALGAMFLGMTLGVIEWSVLLNLISLWPLLIVAAGIDLVGKSLDSGWVRAMSSLVFIGGIAYAVFVMPGGGWQGTLGIDFTGRELTEFAGDAGDAAAFEEATARIDAAAGTVRVESGSGEELLAYEGSSRYVEPDVEISEEGSSAVVTMDMRGGPEVIFGSTRGSSLDLALNRDVEWSLRFKSGAGEFDADLSELEIARVELDSGVGSGTLRLGEPTRDSELRAKSGIASLKVLVPEDAEVRLRVQSGIGSRDLPDDFEEQGDGVYTTPGFEDGERAWEIVVESGIGSLELERY